MDDDPFKANEKEDAQADDMFSGENTGIDFDAYEDIPVSTSGREVPDAVDTFTDIGLPDGLLKNVQVLSCLKQAALPSECLLFLASTSCSSSS
jgi:hypothetical protein